MSEYIVFQNAIKNEIYIDAILMKETRLNLKYKYTLVRPYKIKPIAEKIPSLLNQIVFIAVKAWFFLNFIIHTIKLFNILIKVSGKKKKKLKSNKLVIIATPKIVDQLTKLKDIDKRLTERVYISSCRGMQESKNTTLLNYINLSEIFWAYKRAVLSPLKLKLTGADKLQTYDALEWFLAYKFLSDQKNIEEIWFGNHYDRWAVLFSNLPIQKKVLVQHGIIYNRLPPTKLKGISKVYLINDKQKKEFESIIENNFEYEYLDSTLDLKALVNDDKLRVLVIGNISSYEQSEQYIISRLKNENANIILKPHPVMPVNKYESWESEYDFYLIRDKKLFPKVDIVISYDSTLAIEYEQMGIEVLYYKNYSPEIIVEIIKNRMNTDG